MWFVISLMFDRLKRLIGVDDFDPYVDGPWGTTQWHCIRCGCPLVPISKDDLSHGAASWDHMRKDGTTWYLCSNPECCHREAPLILHHPDGGPETPAGESYSISWWR